MTLPTGKIHSCVHLRHYLLAQSLTLNTPCSYSRPAMRTLLRVRLNVRGLQCRQRVLLGDSTRARVRVHHGDTEDSLTKDTRCPSPSRAPRLTRRVALTHGRSWSVTPGVR